MSHTALVPLGAQLSGQVTSATPEKSEKSTVSLPSVTGTFSLSWSRPTSRVRDCGCPPSMPV
ncbi:hypothetical protein QF026_000243 [Streptomyces aurantiacus]|uniref:hypothetical protein n=1 Tax=Streptomyces aurantiacus TaxID=47760 RepID=UPI00278DFC5C|nr:hypothetical protein [Streptomyces aurantiacus]MDQ0771777.1 hypothetical protein [Streptomyces aurantiacus]